MVSLYEIYLKADEVVDDNRHKQDVNDAIDDMEVDVNTLVRFKRYLQEEDSVGNRNEVERYLVDGCEDPNDDKLYILGWWKINASKYKIFLKVAQHVLVIPISTVASELAFSIGGRIPDLFRSSLSPTIVQALICCQNWLHHGPIPTDNTTLMNDFKTYQNLESSNVS
ncbi:hypothetical protein D5086_024507 [Populus alba]|uniref:Uncharacterized protein n=1 Tax=Populus alba TaxID=43335 RepID=A0ACC4B799_POPAL